MAGWSHIIHIAITWCWWWGTRGFGLCFLFSNVHEKNIL